MKSPNVSLWSSAMWLQLPFFVPHCFWPTPSVNIKQKSGTSMRGLTSLWSFLIVSSLLSGLSLACWQQSSQDGYCIPATHGWPASKRGVCALALHWQRLPRSSALLLRVPGRLLAVIRDLKLVSKYSPGGSLLSSFLQPPVTCCIHTDWQMDLNKLGHRISPGEGTESVGWSSSCPLDVQGGWERGTIPWRTVLCLLSPFMVSFARVSPFLLRASSSSIHVSKQSRSSFSSFLSPSEEAGRKEGGPIEAHSSWTEGWLEGPWLGTSCGQHCCVASLECSLGAASRHALWGLPESLSLQLLIGGSLKPQRAPVYFFVLHTLRIWPTVSHF